MKKNNNRLLIALPFLLLTFFISFPAGAQTSAEISVTITDFLESWLQDSCDLGETPLEERFGLKANLQVESLLITALEKGPGPEMVRRFEESLEAKWKMRTEILRAAEAEALGRENLQLALEITKEEYMKMEMNSFMLRYQDRAMQGLARVGTENARQVLKSVASDSASPLQEAAEKALIEIDKAPTIDQEDNK